MRCCVGRCFGFWIVFGVWAWDLGGALCFGLYLGFRRGIREALRVLQVRRVDLLGGLRIGVKAYGGGGIGCEVWGQLLLATIRGPLI